jgi:hypothetical protein
MSKFHVRFFRAAVDTSKIELPRGTGTCTRCAMEIRLHEDKDSWRATIQLQKKSDEGGGTGTERFGSDITVKSEVLHHSEHFFDKLMISF